MILEKFRLDGKIALVTGGTRGIGLGISRALAEAGAHVILAATSDRTDVIEAFGADGLSAECFAADLEDAGAPDELIAKCLERHGRLDILVNNAGIADNEDTEHFSDERYRRLMSINLDAVFRCCRAALTPMRKQKAGVIVNIGSMSGLVSNYPQPQAAYNASKAAVHMLTKSLASDYAMDNIRVNAVAPGYIATDMTKPGLDDSKMAEAWIERTPMKRVGSPEDVGAACVYLCSSAASFVTGSVLLVDGGYTSR